MKIKKILSFLILLLALWGVARFTHHQTKGFRLSKISHNVSPDSTAHTPPPFDLSTQKFSYLGRGLQSFTFLSEEGSYVLKFFNNRYQTRLFWLSKIPPFPFLKNWKERNFAYNTEKLKQAFESYTLAYTHLKEESGLLYYHPSPCENCPAITLIDPLGISHSVDLSKHAFVLQKKVTLPFPYFAACQKEQDLEKGKRGIDALITLFKTKMEKGIADRDPLIRANCGFYEETALQIDIGPLSLDEKVKEKRSQKEKIREVTLPLKHWLETHYKELAPYLDETLKNL